MNLDLPCVDHIYGKSQNAKPFDQQIAIILGLQDQIIQRHLVPSNPMSKRAKLALAAFRICAVTLEPWPAISFHPILFPKYLYDRVALVRLMFARLARTHLKEDDGRRRRQLCDSDLG